jgi:hypothetical protein
MTIVRAIREMRIVYTKDTGMFLTSEYSSSNVTDMNELNMDTVVMTTTISIIAIRIRSVMLTSMMLPNKYEKRSVAYPGVMNMKMRPIAIPVAHEKLSIISNLSPLFLFNDIPRADNRLKMRAPINGLAPDR